LSSSREILEIRSQIRHVIAGALPSEKVAVLFKKYMAR
jgi:hypothetical protein